MRTAIPWYAPAKQIRQWGEPEPPRHTDHFGLFYDLTFVGGAYVAGLTLKSDLTTSGVLTFVGLVLLMRDAWISNLMRQSQFQAHSLVHAVVDVINLTLTMAMVLHMESTKRLFDPNTNAALALILTYSLIKLVEILRAYDISRNQTTSNGKNFFWRRVGLTGEGISLLSMAAALVFVLTASTLELLWVFLFAATLPKLVAMFFVIKRADHRGTRERDFVPMSVRFVIHRNVEWAMLMLGESVFSLLIVPAQHTLNFYVVFVTGCLTVSNVYVHHFVNYETDPERHCMRIKALRGLIFEYTRVAVSVTLVAFGVSFKVLLENADKGTLKSKYASLFGVSMGLSLFIADVSAILHDTGVEPKGFWSYWRTLLQKQDHPIGRRLGRVWLFKFAVVAICFSFASFELSAVGLSLLAWGLTFMSVLLAVQQTHPCMDIANLFRSPDQLACPKASKWAQLVPQQQEERTKQPHTGVLASPVLAPPTDQSTDSSGANGHGAPADADLVAHRTSLV